MTPLERVRTIPGITATGTKTFTGKDSEIRVNAPDFTLVARRFGDSAWHFIEAESSVPKASYHLTLRKLIHDALNP